MSTASGVAEVVCPECSAVCWIGSPKCWLCGHPIGPDAVIRKGAGLSETPLMATVVDDRSGAAGSSADYQERVRFQFGISSLLLLMTLTSVLFGLFSMAPGLGIAAMVLAVPALVPTCIAAMRKGSRGRPMTALQRTAVFLVWMGLMMAVAVAAGIAFFITCLAGVATSGNLDRGFQTGMVLGGIAALVVAVLMFILFMRVVKF
jgi:hypothetical protein